LPISGSPLPLRQTFLDVIEIRLELRNASELNLYVVLKRLDDCRPLIHNLYRAIKFATRDRIMTRAARDARDAPSPKRTFHGTPVARHC
jgi:hypothetical protein